MFADRSPITPDRNVRSADDGPGRPANCTYSEIVWLQSGLDRAYQGKREPGTQDFRIVTANYINENFPGSVQTQVTGLNGNGVTVGFWAPSNNANGVNANFGFYAEHGRFHEVNFPTSHNSKPPVNQLLGVNDSGVAVGFYTDNNGNNHGYEFNIFTHQFTRVTISGAVSLTAAGINKFGDVTGFYTNAQGVTKGFLIVRRPRDPAVRPRRRVHHGARRQRQEGSRGRVRAQRQPERARRVHLDAARRVHHRQRPERRGHHDHQRRQRLGNLVGFYVDGNGNTDGMLAIPH